MRKKLGAIVLCTFCILTACVPAEQGNAGQAEAAVETTAETTAETTTETTTETVVETVLETEDVELSDMTAMLGMKAEEARNLLGGGTENKTEDGTYLIGHEYEASVMGEDVSVITMYDDNQVVNLVQATFTEKDADSYQNAISEELGVEPESGEDGENGVTATIWQKDGVMYTLFRSFGDSVLEIIIPQN